MNDIFYCNIEMPCSVRAFTILDPNGDFNVYINQDLSDEAKQAAYEHELQHIENGDFDCKDVPAHVFDSPKE